MKTTGKHGAFADRSRVRTPWMVVCTSLLVAWMACATPLLAQSDAAVPLSETIQTEEGDVQFFGLRSWTARSLVDTLKTMAPEGRLLAACATIMERKLGFPDAAPFGWKDSTGTRTYVIAVTEPADSAHVRFRSFPEEASPKTEWFEELGVEPSESRRLLPRLHLILRNYGPALRGHPDSTIALALGNPRARFDSAQAGRVLSFLQARQSEADREEALQVLSENGNKWNRTLAAAVLANFPSSPDAWQELTRALRDPWDPVSIFSRYALRRFAEHRPEAASWEPVLSSLNAIMSGTNYLLTPLVLDLLLKTNVDPSHSAALLQGRSGKMLLAHLRTDDPRTTPAIRAFLRHLSGRKGISTWSEWIHGLN